MSDAWFVYTSSASRISGAPANWKGWVALFACLALMLIAAIVVGGAAAELHPAAGIVALLAVNFAGIFGIVRLVVAKGRRVD